MATELTRVEEMLKVLQQKADEAVLAEISVIIGDYNHAVEFFFQSAALRTGIPWNQYVQQFQAVQNETMSPNVRRIMEDAVFSLKTKIVMLYRKFR